MTAEIAIMNKEGIAIAADSAVTMGSEWGQKIFTSANKLFVLSKYYPVGIMIYGDADFMNIRWETVVKIYRNKLGKQNFDTLTKYANDFIAFLDNKNSLFPEDQQRKYLYGTTLGYFTHQIRRETWEEVKAIIDKEGKITDTRIGQLTSDVIKNHYDKWEKAKKLPSIPKTHINQILTRYHNIIDKAINEVFEKLPISAASMRQLRKISASLFSKDIFPSNISGVVIAGFGEKEPFPSLKSFLIEGIANNKLKYKEDISEKISFDNNAAIVPFAQREMVYTFMEGIDPYLQSYMNRDLSRIFDKYPEIIVKSIERLDDKEKQTLLEKIKQASNSIFKDYKNRITIRRRKYYVEPIIRVVAMLPKDELAMMAESLVSLTSLKRKVTPKSETVGGPIDVAMISKGDGFIWIKRKHYFKAELNAQFFAKYYREE